jgi:hypothetical protein
MENKAEQDAKTAKGILARLEKKEIKLSAELKSSNQTDKLYFKTSKENKMLEEILNSDVIRKCIEIQLKEKTKIQTSLEF